MKKHSILVKDGFKLEILLLTRFRPFGNDGRICVFKIGGEGIVRYYYADIHEDKAKGPTSELMHWLLDRIGTSEVQLLDKVSTTEK